MCLHHDIISGREAERDGRKTKHLPLTPSKKEQSLLQRWNFLESNSSSVAFKTPKIPRLHKMKFQTRSSLTSASIPSDMSELYFWAKVLNIWQKNVYWIRKQEQKTNKGKKVTKHLITEINFKKIPIVESIPPLGMASFPKDIINTM